MSDPLFRISSVLLVLLNGSSTLFTLLLCDVTGEALFCRPLPGSALRWKVLLVCWLRGATALRSLGFAWVSIETETINRNMDSIMEKLTVLQRKIYGIGDQNGQRE